MMTGSWLRELEPMRYSTAPVKMTMKRMEMRMRTMRKEE